MCAAQSTGTIHEVVDSLPGALPADDLLASTIASIKLFLPPSSVEQSVQRSEPELLNVGCARKYYNCCTRLSRQFYNVEQISPRVRVSWQHCSVFDKTKQALVELRKTPVKKPARLKAVLAKPNFGSEKLETTTPSHVPVPALPSPVVVAQASPLEPETDCDTLKDDSVEFGDFNTGSQEPLEAEIPKVHDTRALVALGPLDKSDLDQEAIFTGILDRLPDLSFMLADEKHISR